MRPAAHLLFLSRQEKKAKEGDPTSATPALRAGANLRRASVGVGRRNSLRAWQRSAQTTSASQFTKRLHAALQPPPRQNRAAGAASRGVEQPHGPSLRSAPKHASASRRGSKAERSDGPIRLPPLWTCREAQRVGCAWTPKDVHASCSDSLQLFERSAAKRAASSAAHPAREHRRLPHRNAMGSRPVGRASLGTFLPRSKKVPRPPGRVPASHVPI